MVKPRYILLADRVSDAIQEGTLTPGTRLPTHRAFAEQSGVALATATRAYAELERRGMVTGEAGRGTFVRDTGLPPSLGMRQGATDGLIDLVFNMPGSEGDPDMLRAGLRRLAAAGDLEAMLRYQPHGGRPHERRIIAESLAPALGSIDPERLLITSGGQHGLALVCLGLLRHGTAIAVDPLIYPGFKSAAALQGINLVPVDGAGGVMDPEDLERKARAGGLQAIYLMPTVQNPLGAVMDGTTRFRLIDVARRHELLIIEDAAYAFLETNPPPSLVTLAPERTIHVGGVSKSLATGLRLGYLIAPERCLDGLLEAIRATIWNAPALISGLVTGWIEDGTLARSEEKRRRDGAAYQRICQDVLSERIILAHPNAGFAWLPLEKGMRTAPIVTSLKEQGLSVTGAEPFATTVAVPQALRLAFGGMPVAELGVALQTVRQTIREAEQRCSG